MSAFLPEHVFAAEADGAAIFLDLKRDRYVALPRIKARAFAECARYGGALDPEVEARLVREGLLDLAAGKTIAFTRAPSAAEELGPAHSVGVADIGAALWARVRATARLKRQPLFEIITARGRWRARQKAREADWPRVEARAACFAAVRPLTGGHDACLREALALSWFLGADGADVDWIFGVSGAPFAAHCWMQLGRRVLNDSLDHVRAFTPIMVA